MKLTNKEIYMAAMFPPEIKTDHIGEFRAGAYFARDYYEKQIAGLIESIREQTEAYYFAIQEGARLSGFTPDHVGDRLANIRKIVDEFEGKDGSNP